MSPSYFAEEQSISLFHFFPPRQINSSAQYWGIKPDWNLLGVRMWSPLIEEHGNKTLTWNRQDSGAPRPRKTQEETSLGRFFFLDCCPFTMSSLRNQNLRTVGRKKKRKQQPGETKAPRCKGLPRWHWNRHFLGNRKKNAAELQISYCETMQEARKCSNQQYFTFPSGGTEAPAYEPHANRNRAFLR